MPILLASNLEEGCSSARVTCKAAGAIYNGLLLLFSGGCDDDGAGQQLMSDGLNEMSYSWSNSPTVCQMGARVFPKSQEENFSLWALSDCQHSL